MYGIIEADTEKYLYSLLRRRDATTREMESYAAKHRVPIIGPACGRLLYQLARLVRARRVFQMGSAIRYFLLFVARAVGGPGPPYFNHSDTEKSPPGPAYPLRAGLLG